MEDIEGYKRLGKAVILKAAQDYVAALRRLRKNPRDYKAQDIVAECEKFFRERMWMFTTAEIDGEEIIRELRRKAEHGGRVRRGKR